MSAIKNRKTENKTKLIVKTLIRYFLSLIFVGSLLFLPACSLGFWNAWLFIGTLFIPMFFVLIYLVKRDPALLAKRMKTDEKEKPQKIYVILSLLVFIITFIVPGLDYRYQWSSVPFWLVIISTFIMLGGYLMFFLVMVQNSYASRVIEIQDEQRLIETGLYSVVRHPMYLAGSILYCFSPLVLGSFYALIPVLFIPLLLVIRIKNEEKVLQKGLKGYEAFMQKVKYRLIPFVW